MLSGILVGVHEAGKEPEGSVVSSTPISKQVPLTAQERENAQMILKGLLRTRDQVAGTTWLKPPWAENYGNQIYLYIGITETKHPFLRLKIEYKGEEMPIVRKFVFRIDDKVETIEPTGVLKSDYVVKNHWEWFDELAAAHLDVVQKIARGNKVLMRYQGSQDSHDRTISFAEKASLEQMLVVHRYLAEEAAKSSK
jgi:hypothetical protein